MNKIETYFEKHKFVGLAAAALIGGAFSLGGHALMNKNSFSGFSNKENSSKQMARYAALNSQPAFDFSAVSEIATPAVVHIKTTIGASTQREVPEEFEDFFGPNFRMPQGPRQASGSGVIVSEDGYIVTNNHVVEGATKIEVILNDKRSYVGEVIGTDKNTDLAVVKVSESGLPFLKVGNSDEVKVGQWVVAVGNPFNLTSTVTAGIVSAMGRNIDLLRSKGAKYAIENFIQTDAAVNPGNSGGALVNTAGELIGINTAIASETGSYAGYSFAVPVNLMKKVMNDIIKYGKVQRALLGVQIRDITQELADDKGLKDLKGVYIEEVVESGAAAKAGLKKGDVLLKVNTVEVNSSSRLQEEVGKYKPGDEITLHIRRSGSTMDVKATLLSEEGKVTLEKADMSSNTSYEGLTLANTTKEERTKLSLKNGVKVVNSGSGIFKELPEGFIITSINNESVFSSQTAINNLKKLNGAIVVEGVTSKGDEKIFAIKLPSRKGD